MVKGEEIKRLYKGSVSLPSVFNLITTEDELTVRNPKDLCKP
jgi:hypothetical protein